MCTGTRPAQLHMQTALMSINRYGNWYYSAAPNCCESSGIQGTLIRLLNMQASGNMTLSCAICIHMEAMRIQLYKLCAVSRK